MGSNKPALGGLTCTSWGAEQHGGRCLLPSSAFSLHRFLQTQLFVSIPNSFQGELMPSLPSAPSLEGMDECEQVLQGSSQPRSCPTFRNSKRCTCVTAWHKAVGSRCPETWRRCRGTKAQPCPADIAASSPVPPHRQAKAGQGMDTGPCPRAGLQIQGADNSRSYKTSCFYIVAP